MGGKNVTFAKPTLESLLSAAVALYSEGRLDAAAERCRNAIAIQPDNAAALNLLGLISFAGGDAAEATIHLRRAAEADPGEADYPNNLGVILHAAGDWQGASEAFRAALAIQPNLAQAANNLGSALEKLGDDAGALEQYRRALEIDPTYVEARENLVLTSARVAPLWHFPMMADTARNEAYADALKRAAPGRRVLDIGSGSGLLAMMAARAGAADVTTCEMQPIIAAAAARIVTANGLADQVKVVSARSDVLELGRDLTAPAEVLVTETFSSGLLSEQVLPTVEDAHRRLLAPGAAIIPRRAAARGYLIGGPVIEQHLFAARHTGFDLSGFDDLAPVKLGLHLDRLPHTVLSDDFEIFGFDLTKPPFPPEQRRFEVIATAAGRCVGAAQWLQLDLDDVSRYENRPTTEAGANGWMHVVHRFAQPIDVKPGDRIVLAAAHNRSELVVAAIPSRG